MKIAIIGTGISGNSIAYLLHKSHDITVYEKNNYIGGHSRTVDVRTPDGPIPVDTGFIVYNERNYPHLTALFKHLDVPVKKSDMSFGVSASKGFLEYGTYHKLGGIFAQSKNILRPVYFKMLSDIIKFNKKAPEYLENQTSLTLGELLDEMKMGEWFRKYYLLAMGAAIWSTPANQMQHFPARTFLQFFKNHGLLTIADHPQWYTVEGGSKEYVARLTNGFKNRIKTSCGVKSVIRRAENIEVIDTNGQTEHYDHVIFACHSDQALNILADPTEEEKNILGAIKYQPNSMVLHTDQSFMPKSKKAWSSWIYLSEDTEDQCGQAISLSYWMNNLQPLKTETPILVTLNPGRRPREETIQNEYEFEHPVFDDAAITAQQKLDTIQGVDRIWYCGAWQHFGFHEDGLLSAVNVARKMNVAVPWE